MPTPIENVTAFFAALPEDQGKVAIQQWFTPSTV
jgi:limonene-1,2-epoxide hydrolase